MKATSRIDVYLSIHPMLWYTMETTVTDSKSNRPPHLLFIFVYCLLRRWPLPKDEAWGKPAANAKLQLCHLLLALAVLHLFP